MLAWINSFVLAISTAMAVFLYILSVQPERLSLRIGPGAYKRCTVYRFIAMGFMFVAMASCILYTFHPLPFLPRFLPWEYWVSIVLAVAIAIPSGYLVVRGVLDAGSEALIPRKEHQLYGGIYERVRHPQAWEALFWFVLAFLLHSPFLVLYAILWLPLEYWMIMAEEPDLLLRFGQDYAEYRRRTPAFLPRLKK
ncbi:MAG: hypothetical protein ABIJ39_01965 [Chloroflexota bacterium]